NDQISLSLPGGLAADETTIVFQAVGGAGNDALASNVELFATAHRPSFAPGNFVGGPGQDVFVCLLVSDITATGLPFPASQGAVVGDPFDLALVSPGRVNVFGLPLNRIL